MKKMKTNKSELDIDFLGGEGPLTANEEKEISEYLKKQREGSTKPNPKGSKNKNLAA
jgi:hypothetical protein